jgi:glutathione synthase/RimK-type ligase-like ATP-grasp enzyme
MPSVLLLTAQVLPAADRDTPLLARALAERGVDVTVAAWTDPAIGTAGPAAAFDLAVIRSTWDYHQRSAAFLTALEHIAAPVLNPLPVIRWNAHKGYLAELAAAGVPSVPTAWVVRGQQHLPDVGTAMIVIKPAVSAGAIGLARFRAGDPAARAHLTDLTAIGDVLVQPYLPEITLGERSLLFLGGEYSHAVRKLPAAGDFRVQSEYGGSVLPHRPTGAELATARAALAHAPGPDLLYARVDLVGSPDAPLVIELELIEPELFLPGAPAAVDRLADAVLAGAQGA